MPRDRSALDPAEHGEPHSSYLDRSARPQFAAARERINEWFSRICPTMQAGAMARLRSGDDYQFSSAYWELYLHELFVRLGYEVVCEPLLPSGRRIDFLVTREGSSMYVEATVAHSSDDERAADARRNRLYRELERVDTDRFMLGIEIERAGSSDMPNVKQLRSQLETWLAMLDPDEVGEEWERAERLPEFRWEAAGWSLVFEALALQPEFQGEAIDRPLGMFMDETGGQIDDETPLRRALERKAPRRYGDLDHPYVIAVCEFPFSSHGSGWHRRNVLYGRSAVTFGPNGTEEVRHADGFWRGRGQRPRNKRVAATILAAEIQPWYFDDNALTWWDNPFADVPVADALVLDVVERHQLVVQDGRGEFNVSVARTTPSAVFDVEPISD